MFTKKLPHSQPHSRIPVSCQELADDSRLLSKTLACNVSSPIFKAGRQVSVGQPSHKGLSWQAGRRSWLWGREQVADQEGSICKSIQSCFASLSLDLGSDKPDWVNSFCGLHTSLSPLELQFPHRSSGDETPLQCQRGREHTLHGHRRAGRPPGTMRHSGYP